MTGYYFWFILSANWSARLLLHIFSSVARLVWWQWILNYIRSFFQVDLPGLLSAVPLPLSQGVLLALLQQLSCDMGNDTSKKLGWMTEVAAAINPTDPMIAMHVRPIFDQVYQALGHQRNLPSTSNSEASMIRLLMHVINSVLMSCKWLVFCHILFLNTLQICKIELLVCLYSKELYKLQGRLVLFIIDWN